VHVESCSTAGRRVRRTAPTRSGNGPARSSRPMSTCQSVPREHDHAAVDDCGTTLRLPPDKDDGLASRSVRGFFGEMRHDAHVPSLSSLWSSEVDDNGIYGCARSRRRPPASPLPCRHRSPHMRPRVTSSPTRVVAMSTAARVQQCATGGVQSMCSMETTSSAANTGVMSIPKAAASPDALTPCPDCIVVDDDAPRLPRPADPPRASTRPRTRRPAGDGDTDCG